MYNFAVLDHLTRSLLPGAWASTNMYIAKKVKVPMFKFRPRQLQPVRLNKAKTLSRNALVYWVPFLVL